MDAAINDTFTVSCISVFYARKFGKNASILKTERIQYKYIHLCTHTYEIVVVTVHRKRGYLEALKYVLRFPHILIMREHYIT